MIDKLPVGAGRRQVRHLRRDLGEQPPLARHDAGQGGPRLAADRLVGRVRSVRAHAVTLRAGVARRDITQPLGTPSSLGLFRTVTEVWDPLSATAVVLESDGERVALVGLDLCGLLEASHRSIREAVAARTGLPADRVVLNVSHTPQRARTSAPTCRSCSGRTGCACTTTTTRRRSRPRSSRPSTRRRTGPSRHGSRSDTGTVERVAGNRRPKLPDGRTVHRYGRPPEELRALPEGLIDPAGGRHPVRSPGRRRDRRDPVLQLPPDRLRAGHPDQRLGRLRGPRPDRDRGGRVRGHLRLPAGLRRQPGHRQVGVRHGLGGHGGHGRALRPGRGRGAPDRRPGGRRRARRRPVVAARSSSTRSRRSPSRRPPSSAPPATPSSPTSSRSATASSWLAGSTELGRAPDRHAVDRAGPRAGRAAGRGLPRARPRGARRVAVREHRRRRLQRQHAPVHPDRGRVPRRRVRGRRRLALHPAGRGRADGATRRSACWVASGPDSVGQVDGRGDDLAAPVHQVGLGLGRPLEQPVGDREESG